MKAFVRAGCDWAEDHWEAVGLALSIGCALVTAAILTLAFNAVTTQLDREPRDLPSPTTREDLDRHLILGTRLVVVGDAQRDRVRAEAEVHGNRPAGRDL
jgi:hypothetical protein